METSDYQALKKDTLKMIRRIYRMVENDECPGIEALHAGLTAGFGNKQMNKTEAAAYMGISVSTFDRYVAEGRLPHGHKKRNECLKWKASELSQKHISL